MYVCMYVCVCVLYYVVYKALTEGVCRNCVDWEVGGDSDVHGI